MKYKYQVLVSALNAKDEQLYSEMNLSSNAIVINQCKDEKTNKVSMHGHDVVFIHSMERGVGKSRNLAIKNSEAEIIEFADDDMIFVKDHEKLALSEFENHPEADIILFSLNSLNPQRPLLKISSFQRVGLRKAMKYGCARIAVRSDKLLNSGVHFSELFGGGARYGSGEDTLFLLNCLRAGLKIYESPIKIADVKQDTSTWFNGYNEKYYRDKGALYAAMFPQRCYFYAIVTSVKRKSETFSRLHILKLYFEGIKDYKRERATEGVYNNKY